MNRSLAHCARPTLGCPKGHSPERQALHFLAEDDAGTATLEYLIVLIGFTAIVSCALLAIGPGLVEQFQLRVAWLAAPIP